MTAALSCTPAVWIATATRGVTECWTALSPTWDTDGERGPDGLGGVLLRTALLNENVGIGAIPNADGRTRRLPDRSAQVADGLGVTTT